MSTRSIVARVGEQEEQFSGRQEKSNMTLAEKIRAWRLTRGMSLARLASAARMSKGHLSSIEHARFSPGVLTLIKISNALDLDARRLLALTSLQVTMEDPFVRQVKPYLSALNHEQRKNVLKTLAAAPKQTKRR